MRRTAHAASEFELVAGDLPGAGFNNIVRGDGTTWMPLGSGVDDVTYDLCVYDDPLPGGPKLIASGAFSTAGGALAKRVAQWDGANWSGIAGGVGQVFEIVFTSVVHDDGTGSKLYVGGEFFSAGFNPVNHIACWDGLNWSSDVTLPGFNQWVFSLASFDDGSGNPPRLIAGGNFKHSLAPGGVATVRIAAWDGSAWSSVVDGTGVDQPVYALAEHDDGNGAALYAGGSFAVAGEVVANRIAKWTASAAWSPVGNGVGADNDVLALASWDEGTGGAARLFATGRFAEIDGIALSGIARWDGVQWSALDIGLIGGEATGYALATYDDGGGEALYVGGGFQSAGSVNARRIAKWDGASWSALGAGVDRRPFALARFDDGSGEQLYVAGDFDFAGTLACAHIARWNGTTWSDVGGGIDGTVYALTVFDDGTGPALYAAGSFTHAGGASALRVARWNGIAWSSVGAGFANGQVNELSTFSDCNGRALYAGGTFTASGVAPVKGIATWTGSQWSARGGGVDTAGGSVEALLSFDDGLGFGQALWVGGNFTQVDGGPNPYLARWARECDAPQSFCFAGPSANGCVPALAWSDSPSAAGSTQFDVSAANIDGQRTGLFFYGTNGPLSSPWGPSSLLCVKAPTQRTGLQSSNGSAGACDGVLTLDWNAYLAAHPTAQGAPFSAGDDVWIQAWYRDPAAVKTTHLSNALRFQVCP